MKYAVEMGSGAVIYIISFVKIGSGIQKLMGGGGGTQTHRQLGDGISLLLFIKNKESRLNPLWIRLSCPSLFKFCRILIELLHGIKLLTTLIEKITFPKKLIPD
jgi:hypothetical protein